MFDALSLPILIALFALGAAVVVACGAMLTSRADRLADATGLGEAVVGGLMLGAATSLPGIVATVTAALDGLPSLALSNAVGGIAVQTLFLVVADLAYRRANLEHAAADAGNLISSGALILMLSCALAAGFAPAFTIFSVHPVSLLLFAIYFVAMRRAVQLADTPMWTPRATPHTRDDEPDEDAARQPILPLVASSLALGLVVAVAGWLLAKTGTGIAREAGLSQSLVGALMIAVVTSLPELVTTLAAVRRGALQLAVGGIIGGNAFDALFLSLGDIAYRDGSLYHAVGNDDRFVMATALAMTAALLLGLIMRDRKGIGLEGGAIAGLYAMMVFVQLNR
ncbi:sodium:calcium antiporter [Roseobacter sp. HKCCA0434]|uniref:sodium:calcium antiporter n=1 Tax=Roseobacter sp. HKCCA0434 TaxID=3079297 RepID=UPI0029059350|nr:sodium:calcium antiporter [Roseobacter sp. HKCCA0434]